MFENNRLSFIASVLIACFHIKQVLIILHTRSGLPLLYQCEIILSHIPTHTRSSDPYVSSLSEKSVPHRYPCEISVTNTR